MTRYEIIQNKDIPYSIIVKEWRHWFYSSMAYPLYKIESDAFTFFDVNPNATSHIIWY